MFIDEAKLAAQLSHNNIIQIYDLGKVDDDFYIAMEYVEGWDLRSILNAGRERGLPLPLPLALAISAAVARALDYAHRKRDFSNRALGLVHRDVSPQNVLISHEGEIKLCDFGIVKAVSKASTTQMGALKGKLQYMSPEQAWGREVDARSDIFSLGAVIFEVLTGTKLFTGDSEIGVLDAVRDCRIRSPREIVPSIPEEVERILFRALAKNPEDRYQTAGQLEKDLTAVLDGLRLTPGQRDMAEYLQLLFNTPLLRHDARPPAAQLPQRSPSSAAFPAAHSGGPHSGGPYTGMPHPAPPSAAPAKSKAGLFALIAPPGPARPLPGLVLPAAGAGGEAAPPAVAPPAAEGGAPPAEGAGSPPAAGLGRRGAPAGQRGGRRPPEGDRAGLRREAAQARGGARPGAARKRKARRQAGRRRRQPALEPQIAAKNPFLRRFGRFPGGACLNRHKLSILSTRQQRGHWRGGKSPQERKLARNPSGSTSDRRTS